MKLLVLLFAIFATACAATGTKIDKFDRREVHRSYTMPEGMNSWSILAAYNQWDTNDNNHDETTGGANPLYFEHPINDDFTLVWSPLPFGFIWSPVNSDSQKASFDLNYFLFGYNADIKFKQILNDSLALELVGSTIFYDAVFFEEQKDLASVGLIWQLTDHFALKPSFGYGKLEGDSEFMEALFESLFAAKVDSHTKFNIFQYGLDAYINLNRQWDFKFGVAKYELIDYSSADTPLIITAGLTYYWDHPVAGEESVLSPKPQEKPVRLK